MRAALTVDPYATMTHPATPVWHQPVMVEPVLEFLRPRRDGVIVDGTAGTGGHSLAILPRLLPNGILIAIDRDPDALAVTRQRLAEFTPVVRAVHGNYARLPEILKELGHPRVDGLLLDLGMSSLQVEQGGRGFSFLHEGPLDMRMDPTQATTAADLVNALPMDELAFMLETFGEERFARRIAQRIVRERSARPITTTTHLADLIRGTVPAGARHGRLHPATRTFQALRIAVNEELDGLTALLDALPDLLTPGGRAVILTYHSLEDRPVKQAFARGKREGRWTVLTKKPVRPSTEEVRQNPRARSAKLRAVEQSA